MSFSREIINWYHIYKRDLPWRATRDPYVIWLSEVILQQTRVDQGLPYFHRFVERFPEVRHFAEASEDEILRYWQGLGYYSRARNMHQAARTVMMEHDGRFPDRYDALIGLKGVGEYTAAAIASFAADEPKAVVDGNVYRVLARYFGVDLPINSPKGKKYFQELADQVMDRESPGTYNQAVMEFGALQCKPHNPDCSVCVLRTGCHALAKGLVAQLPVKLKTKRSRDRYFHYFLLRDDDGMILMHKRGPGDIWENLYELPLIETPAPVTIDAVIPDVEHAAFHRALSETFGSEARISLVHGPVKHVLSHQNIHARFYLVEPAAAVLPVSFEKNGWDYVTFEKMNKLAKPKLIFSFLEKYLGVKN